MLTRVIDWKIPCIYFHIYQIIKNWVPGLYNSLCRADNRRYFLGLSNVKLKGSAHVLLGEGSGKIWTCSCWEKDNFIIINEFKYGQTWKIWPSWPSLSLYSTLKSFDTTALERCIFLSKSLKSYCHLSSIAVSNFLLSITLIILGGQILVILKYHFTFAKLMVDI